MIHYYRYLFVKMKVFNYSELHFSEGTSFKIHTLAPRIKKLETYFALFIFMDFCIILFRYVITFVFLPRKLSILSKIPLAYILAKDSAFKQKMHLPWVRKQRKNRTLGFWYLYPMSYIFQKILFHFSLSLWIAVSIIKRSCAKRPKWWKRSKIFWSRPSHSCFRPSLKWPKWLPKRAKIKRIPRVTEDGATIGIGPYAWTWPRQLAPGAIVQPFPKKW